MIGTTWPAPRRRRASTVKRRHRAIRASATYSASYVFIQPSSSATRHASRRNRFGLRRDTGAPSNRSNAMSASSAEISLRQRISCNADDTSDQKSTGAMRRSFPNRSKPPAARHAWTAALASRTITGQRPSRERRTARTTSGIGSPVAVLRHSAGRRISPGGTSARRSDSSMRCCVPARRDGRRPDRIQRRTVSGLQRTRRAASGTVIMGVAYYNRWVACHPACRVKSPGSPRCSAPPSRSALQFCRQSAARPHRGGPDWEDRPGQADLLHYAIKAGIAKL